MKTYEQARDEAAENRSKRQNSSGDELLDKAISRYLRIGFEDGSDFGRSYEQKLNADLLADNKSMKSMIEHLVSRYLDYRYDNEFFKGHSEHIDLLKMQQTLSQLKVKYDE